MALPFDSLFIAIGWGIVTAMGLAAGALLGVFAHFSHLTFARTMSLGAGLLLSAASVDLAAEVIKVAPYQGVLALLIGAAAFSVSNVWLSARGAKNRKRCGECVAQTSEAEMPDSGLAIALGTAMDTIPEALVLGMVLYSSGPDAALILAIGLGNLPEAMSASAGMRAANRSIRWILGLWGVISLATALLTGVGFGLAHVLNKNITLLLQAFSAGALLAMVSETLLPEAAHEGPSFSGLLTAIGFAALMLLLI